VIVTDEHEQDRAGEREGATDASAEQLAACTLAAVDEQAWRYGVRPGQRVSEATTYVGGLEILRISRAQIRGALGKVAEVALAHGTTAAIGLGAGEEIRLSSPIVSYPGGSGAGPADTVWLDVSGCARLVGGEDVLREELADRVGELGFATRIAVADGPRIAQAVARWGRGELIVPTGRGASALESLPIAALPLEPELLGWLGKLGILHIADLGRLDRAQLAARLGPQARDLLAWIAGRDEVPLRPYEPPRHVTERMSFEHEIEGVEPLMFVMSSLVSRASLRLEARGEATSQVRLELGYDRAIARLRDLEPTVELELELPVPLSASAEILRAARAKLESFELGAPVRSVALRLDGLSEAPRRQLDLSRGSRADPQALSTLLAELSAWIGTGRIGVLRAVDSHRPEAQSPLVPIDPTRRLQPVAAPRVIVPTRLLPQPLLVGKLEPGGLISVDRDLFVLDRLRLTGRIDRIEWWTSEPLSRDYAQAWLHTAGRDGQPHEHGRAWVYVDRRTGAGALHGWFE
jgi:protein ImuB